MCITEQAEKSNKLQRKKVLLKIFFSIEGFLVEKRKKNELLYILMDLIYWKERAIEPTTSD